MRRILISSASVVIAVYGALSIGDDIATATSGGWGLAAWIAAAICVFKAMEYERDTARRLKDIERLTRRALYKEARLRGPIEHPRFVKAPMAEIGRAHV